MNRAFTTGSRLARAVSAAGLLAVLLAPPAHAAATNGFVFTTDFSSGSLSGVNLDTRGVGIDVADPGCADARLRWHDGRLYVVNRLGCDNVLVLDPANSMAPLGQFSTGNGSNPSDILIVTPTKAYVPRYELGGLLIMNPTNGATLGQVSLAAFADADGIPEMDRVVRWGDRVFVSIQRLDRPGFFQPTDASYVAVIDATADTLVDTDLGTAGTQGILLTGKNPVTAFGFDPATNRLLLGCAGVYGVLDGGIEWVNPVTLQSDGWAITETALGGDIGDFAWNGPARSYASISDASFDAHLVSWSAVTGLKIATMFSPGGFSIGDIELNDRGELYVCDNKLTAPGLYVFSTATDAIVAGPLGTGLPPSQIVFDRSTDPLASVDPLVAVEAGVRMSAPWPNPARGFARIGLSLARQGDLRVEILDLAGRRVRTLASGERGPGPVELRWDLRDDRALEVAPGVYLVRAAVGTFDEKFIVRRVAVLY